MTTTIEQTTTDVIIFDEQSGYDAEIPDDVLADRDKLTSWLEDWAWDYLRITGDQYLRGDTIMLQVIDTDSRDVLHYGAIRIAAAERNR